MLKRIDWLKLTRLRKAKTFVSCGVRDKIKEYHLSLSSMDVVKGDYGINSTYT
jgi:hypothetical protein